MTVLKYFTVALLFLIFPSVILQGQDFKIIVPDPDISGVTTVNIADLNNDQLPDIAAFEGGKHAQGRQLFAWYEAPDWIRHEFNPGFNPGPFTGDSEGRNFHLKSDTYKVLRVRVAGIIIKNGKVNINNSPVVKSRILFRMNFKILLIIEMLSSTKE